MKHKLLCIIFFIATNHFVNGQSVGIGTSNPDASSLLELKSTNKGILIPRTDTNTIKQSGNPAKALLIYQNSDNSFYYFDGIRWVGIASKNNTNGSLTQLNKILYEVHSYASGTESNDVWLINYDGTNSAKVNISLPSGFIITYGSAKLSPNGTKIIFQARNSAPGSGDGDIFICNIDGTATTKLTNINFDYSTGADHVNIGGAY